MPLQKCILNDEDRECNMKTGDVVENQIAYFCGQDVECSYHGSRKALALAKANVERFFIVVGLLERIEDTFKILEADLGCFMKGISKLYVGVVRNKALVEVNVSPEAVEKMKKTLELEYDFYRFIEARLEKRLKSL